jgi:addiction module RelE/StbE family toxin
MLITTTKKFDKKIKKQPKKIQEQFKKRIQIFLANDKYPTLKVHKLSGKLKGLWSFSVTGDIRVVFDQDHKGVIILVDIGSHSELYS